MARLTRALTPRMYRGWRRVSTGEFLTRCSFASGPATHFAMAEVKVGREMAMSRDESVVCGDTVVGPRSPPDGVMGAAHTTVGT